MALKRINKELTDLGRYVQHQTSLVDDYLESLSVKAILDHKSNCSAVVTHPHLAQQAPSEMI